MTLKTQYRKIKGKTFEMKKNYWCLNKIGFNIGLIQNYKKCKKKKKKMEDVRTRIESDLEEFTLLLTPK